MHAGGVSHTVVSQQKSGSTAPPPPSSQHVPNPSQPHTKYTCRHHLIWEERWEDMLKPRMGEGGGGVTWYCQRRLHRCGVVQDLGRDGERSRGPLPIWDFRRHCSVILPVAAVGGEQPTDLSWESCPLHVRVCHLQTRQTLSVGEGGGWRRKTEWPMPCGRVMSFCKLGSVVPRRFLPNLPDVKLSLPWSEAWEDLHFCAHSGGSWYLLLHFHQTGSPTVPERMTQLSNVKRIDTSSAGKIKCCTYDQDRQMIAAPDNQHCASH